MKRTTTTLVTLLVIVTMVASLTACTGPSREANAEAAKPKEALPSVSVVVVTGTEKTTTIQSTATLLPDKQVAILPLVAGTITSVNVEMGDEVQKSDVLFTIDETDYALGVSQAKAQLALSKQAQSLAYVQKKNAKKQYDRYKTLKGKGAVTQAQLDEISTAYDMAKVQVSQAAAQVALSEVGVENAETTLAKTKVKAPFDGEVVTVNIDVGSMVSSALPSGALVMVDTKTILVQAAIAETSLSAVDAGVPVTLSTEAYPGTTFEGTIRAVSPIVDKATRTVMVEAVLANDAALGSPCLKPGMAATLAMTTKPKTLIEVPLVALQSQSGSDGVVWIVDDKGAVVDKTVTIARKEGTSFFVSSGLAAGDEVIVAAPKAVAPGHQVSILKSEPMTTAEVSK